MSEKSSHDRRDPAPIGGDLVIPVAAVVFTLYYGWTIIDSPWTAQVGAVFVGVILLALCLILFIVVGLRLSRGEATLRFSPLIQPRAVAPKRAALFVLTLAYIFFIDLAGFTITTFLFLCLGMLVLSEGRNKRLIVGLAVGLSIGGYLLFVVAFERRFPEGPFEALYKAGMAALTGG
jgi:putative tricarboxylic transport membrane protein